MNNQKIKIAEQGEEWKEGEVEAVDRHESQLRAEQLAGLSPEEQAQYDAQAALNLMAPNFTREEWEKWNEQLQIPQTLAALDELTREFNKRQTENLKAHFEQVSKRGQMSPEEWSWPTSWIPGCQAVLCELDPDFDLTNISNLGDYKEAALRAIERTIQAGKHKKASKLGEVFSSWSNTEPRENWHLLAEYDAVLGATGKWRISVLEKGVFQEKYPNGYTLRQLMRFARTLRTTQKQPKTRTFARDEGFLAEVPNGKADFDLHHSLMRYPDWPLNEHLVNRYHEGKNGHTVVYQPSEVEIALGDAPDRALDALDRRFLELKSEILADVIDILFHHWNTHKDGKTSAVAINAAKLCEYRGKTLSGENLTLHWHALRDAFSLTLRDTKSDINAKVFNFDSKGENQDGPGARYAYRPGIFIEYALQNRQLYLAPFLQKVWALDPARNNEAKRLARYLRGDWRMNTEKYLESESGAARAARWHTWAFLLAETGIDVDSYRTNANGPKRLIETMNRAVETLYQMEIIAEGGFDIYHKDDRGIAENLPRRGALDTWLALRVCMAPAAKLREALLPKDGKRRAGRERDAKILATERAKKQLRAEEGKAPRKRKN